MLDLILSGIFIYPIKSLGGVSVESAVAEERGLQHDRRWMLVDESGKFLSQREYPQMALFSVSILENRLLVTHKKSNSSINIPFQNQTKEILKVKIWEDACSAAKISNESDEWFSDLLGIKCTLVYMLDDERRIVDKKYVDEEKIVGFADAYPFLIIGQSSLDDLNSKLRALIPMNRFRTNFVFTGGVPFAEDNWKDFNIGDVHFKAVKPCARCVVTTINQETGERNYEPLQTLSYYRKVGGKVIFGMNVICKTIGRVSIGDKIEIINSTN
jgi:hypothetical protein